MASANSNYSLRTRQIRIGSTARKPPVVFVVDDEEHIANTCSLILQAAGCQVYTFYDGADVLSHAPTIVPDVVVTDFEMPKMNGLALAAWLREHYPQCRVVMITGHAGALPNVERGGHFTLLNKPVPAQELIAIVKEAA